MSDLFFDKEAPLNIYYSNHLQHWNQEGKIISINFRLADSLPQSTITQLNQIKENFFNENPTPWTEKTHKIYRSLISKCQEEMLDRGYGSCLLRNTDLRNIVDNTLKYHSGKSYNLIAYVIMPNHIHLVVELYEGVKIEKILHSLKSYSATLINKIRHEDGPVWMKGRFDRLVRSPKHLRNYVAYIKNNPSFLPSSDYSLYVNESYLDELWKRIGDGKENWRE